MGSSIGVNGSGINTCISTSYAKKTYDGYLTPKGTMCDVNDFVGRIAETEVGRNVLDGAKVFNNFNWGK